MWVRSQNKKYLINCKNLGIRKMLNKYVVALISECADFYTLGSYSTEEKALKVLNEIQEVIEDNQFTINNTGIGDYVLYNSVQVYDMPQDDEV